jgi:peroxiredoxin
LLVLSLPACSNNKAKEVIAPDFTLQTTDGETITLSKLRGQPVMLTFWSINCSSCRYQEPFLQAFYANQKNKSLKLITVNAGDPALAVEQHAISSNMTFPILLDTNRKVARDYGLPGVPVTVFVDSRGYVAAYKIGPFQSREDIEKAVDSIWSLLTKTS